MILVDTSVWIRFLANRAPYAGHLDILLEHGEVAGHELIYGELLIGDRGGRAQMLAHYKKMHHAAMVPHDEVADFARARKLHGRGIGWIDVHLLASAVVDRLQLWTADDRFAAIVRELRIPWEIPSL